MRDFILNGTGHGPVGEAFNVRNRLTGKFDPGLLRPFIETDPSDPDVGKACAQLQVGMIYNNKKGVWVPDYEKRTVDDWQSRGVNSPVFNATTWTRDDWIQIDRVTQKVPRQPLVAYNDLRAANTKGGFDAWTKLSLEYNAQSDVGEVVKSMDATDPSRDDTPLMLLRSLPLPIIHGGFSYPQRLLDSQRAAGMGLDTDMFENIVRRGWESVEKCYIGTETGVTWGARSTGPFPQTGASSEFGLTNWTYRVTKIDLTTPLGSNPEAVLQDVLEMIETMNTNGYYGPFDLYTSTGYTTWLKGDYFRTGSTATTRTVEERLLGTGDIRSIKRLPYLTSGYQLLMIDLSSGQFQAIDGMMPKWIQWSERGGLINKFLMMMIQTALFRAPYTGSSPALIHGTTS